jgi:hypothetical protein
MRRTIGVRRYRNVTLKEHDMDKIFVAQVETDDNHAFFVSYDADVCEESALTALGKALDYEFEGWMDAQNKSCEQDFTDTYGEYILRMSLESILP